VAESLVSPNFFAFFCGLLKLIFPVSVNLISMRVGPVLSVDLKVIHIVTFPYESAFVLVKAEPVCTGSQTHCCFHIENAANINPC
jgi:hypothetical protein